MKIQQWEDKNLAQYSYAILSDCEKKIVLIDPSRDPQQYLDFANQHQASIVGIIETHPHADFISGHLELHQLTNATIYAHSLVGASYPHAAFDDGAVLEFGKIRLTSLHTPGHSPDSISILLEHDGKQKAVFTGDTLFIGDCGRPDLREGVGNIHAKRHALAKQMYHSLRSKLSVLDDDVIVYPGHGAGTLCGKNLSKESSGTIGHEKQANWSLQEATEEAFVENLLKDQPFIPAYFAYDVELNRIGAPIMKTSISAIEIGKAVDGWNQLSPNRQTWIVDARREDIFKAGHLPYSINLMEDGKFETWLGSLIMPHEQFYLAGESMAQLDRLFKRIAAIGYEGRIKKAFVLDSADLRDNPLDVDAFRNNQEDYTIVDIRNNTEVQQKKPFANSLSIPLPELRQRIHEIPTDKPIVVHCAGGYRSAAGSSIIKSMTNGPVSVFDLGDAIKKFGL